MGNVVTTLSSIIVSLFSVVAQLSQLQTNGNSVLGTFTAPNIAQFLTNNPIISGFPWGTLTASGNNPYTSAPTTGVIRSYDFTISRGTLAPDGYQKQMLLINGQFPGPTIEANWGDTIQVTVHNALTSPDEGTGLHWHGILQKSSPWMDGVPGVQQCPIAPGSSFTYTFKADLYGTSWYHSHYSAQYAGGLLGPMIIHGPQDGVTYDIDVGPVILSDWYHDDYMSIVKSVMSNGSDFNPAPESDNNLINGKANFDCSTVDSGDTTKCTNNAGISTFKFTTGKVHRLRLINAGAEGLQRFSIDGHTLTVIANDFVPIKPYTTKVVTLGIGQRTDVLVTANAGKSNTAYWMRSNISTICSASKQPLGVAAIYYDKADTTKSPTSQAWNIADPGTCANDDLSTTTPLYTLTPSPSPATTRSMDIDFGFNATGHFLWTMDGTSFRADYNTPTYLLANLGNQTYKASWNVKDFGSNSTIRIILNNKTPVAHPMHIHGHNMFILAEGTGNWDGKTVINPSNPQRRDVQMLRPNGYLVLQIDADNPGVWPLHCHIAWHVSGGLYANILERPKSIASVSIPNIMAQTCRDWASWTGTTIVDMIDSGL